MRVEVYYNLHRSCWSIRAISGRLKGLVVAHAAEVELFDCTYVVQPAGRARVLREGKKNVHAFVRGELAGIGGAKWLRDASDECRVDVVVSDYGRVVQSRGAEAYYNPFKVGAFVAAADHTRVIADSRRCVLTAERRVFTSRGPFHPQAIAA